MVEAEWLRTKELRPDMNLELFEYVVMPNHFHGIIFIDDNKYNADVCDNQIGDAMHRVSTYVNDDDISDNPKNRFGPHSKNLASVVRGFKSSATTFARKNDLS
ncbi:MAG TPA: hypothetical protein VGI43_16745, partial [Mucilaginibacter sp.]